MGTSFFIATLGCKVNQYDGELVREALLAAGCEEKPLAAGPDVAVVNTCTVTGVADAKARRLIRHIARTLPRCRILVTGCMVNRAREQLLLLPGVWQAVPNERKAEIAALVVGETARPMGQADTFGQGISDFAGHTRAFVKVQDGCDAGCAYCIVPSVRGAPRSRPLADVVEEVNRLSGRFNEIVLTGVHLGVYRDVSGAGLAELASRVLAETTVRRVRLSSIEVAELTPELLDVAASSERFCPHFHVPLQSGSDRVLRLMNRRYTAGEFLAALDRMRRRLDRPALTTDVIVGFPGETDEDFAKTVATCRAAGFSRVHIFRYSERPGTAAASRRDRCSASVAADRHKELERVAAELALRYKEAFLGETVEVLTETSRDRSGRLCGYTSRYLRVLFDGPDELRGCFASVAVERAKPGSLFGALAAKKP